MCQRAGSLDVWKIVADGRGTALYSTMQPWRYTKIQRAPIRQLSGIALLDRASCWGIVDIFGGTLLLFEARNTALEACPNGLQLPESL